MALLLPTLGELSGSVRGNVFSHNKSGAYIRGRTIPTNPSATKQAAARAILASLSSQWSTLASEQRADWNSWAEANPVVNRLGQSFKRSGQQAFVGLNSRVLAAGGTTNTSCPSTTGPTDLLIPTVVATAPGTIAVTFTPTPVPADSFLVLWATLPANVGRNPNRNQARLVGYSEAEAISPVTFTSPYSAIAGQMINIWLSIMDTFGQVSPGIKVGPVIYG